MDIAVVGAGRVGTALAVLLRAAGHPIVAVSGSGEASVLRASRYLGLQPIPAVEAAAAGALVLIATPDDAIEPVCADLAAAGSLGPGRFVGHLSGATGLDALDTAAEMGSDVLCIHPFQTLPTVEAALERIPGSPMAVTAETERGFELGERLATDVGASPFRLSDPEKVWYHAAAVFGSNYLIVLSGIAEDLLRAAGVEAPLERLQPLQRASIENALAMGPADALTGPAVRGDAGTIERHLEALGERAPRAVEPYIAMCRAALDLAVRSGRLSADRRAVVEEVLARWR